MRTVYQCPFAFVQELSLGYQLEHLPSNFHVLFFIRQVRVLAYWQSKRITEAVKAKNLNGKTFYFLDGPPYVTGDLHPAHIWTKGMKDAFVRYRRYCGFNVIDRPGYDLHGLPIENKIEKDLGIKSKKEIEEKIGIERFVQECRK